MFCHSEQGEESVVLHQILRFAQNDKKIKYTNNFNQVLIKKNFDTLFKNIIVGRHSSILGVGYVKVSKANETKYYLQ